MLGSSTDIKVRKSKAADAAALTSIFAESWRLAYLGIIPGSHLDDMIRRRNAAWWINAIRAGEDVLTLTFAGKIAGYATFGRTRIRTPYQGEIYELYLSPIYQGLGFGEHLFEGCRHELDERRLRGLLVWALKDNDAACDFYRRRGGRKVGKTLERMGGVQLEKIAFGWD